jgi:NTE family protein
MEGAFYEVGVLCALEDAIEGLDFTRLDAYVGVSAGAVIASMLANGVSPATMSRAIVGKAPDTTLNLNPDILFTPALSEYARRLWKVPSALGRWARRRMERPMDVSPMGALLELSSLAPIGLFDTRPLERFLARAFATADRTNDFRALRATLRIVAVELNTSALVSFGDAQTEHVPISRAVQASISLPGLYCPTEIEGEHYIDGVARRTLNATLALDDGVELLFCINPIVPVDVTLSRHANGTRRDLADYGLPVVLSQTLRTVVHSRMRTAFRGYAHAYPNADVILIEPAMDDDKMFFSNIFSVSKRKQVCDHAYTSTMRHLASRASELEPMLAKRGLRLRQEVLDAADRSLFSDDDSSTPARNLRSTLSRLERVLAEIAV